MFYLYLQSAFAPTSSHLIPSHPTSSYLIPPHHLTPLTSPHSPTTLIASSISYKQLGSLFLMDDEPWKDPIELFGKPFCDHDFFKIGLSFGSRGFR